MLIHEIFTIHDGKAHAYITPFFLPTNEMAIRSFIDGLNNPEHAFNRHPEDYTLFHIGQYFVDTAEINAHTPVSLGNGLDHKTQEVLPFTDDRQIDLSEATHEVLSEVREKFKPKKTNFPNHKSK